MTFEEWWEQYDGGHGLSEQAAQDAWDAALEVAKNIVHQKLAHDEIICDAIVAALEKHRSGKWKTEARG